MIIRVFPRRTSMTPQDPYAFVGDPPLWRPKVHEAHVSVAFTWDIAEGKRLQRAWSNYYDVVKLGGPAIDGTNNGGEFTPGQYVKPGVVITSRGCPRKCPWCLVPPREGNLLLLEVKPGWIVQDNNLLATPKGHQERVYAMLRSQGRRISFPGGLDPRLVNAWVADQLRTIPIHQVFLSADYRGSIEPLKEAVEHLSFLNRYQLRCYVLIAYNGETIEEAEERLEEVWNVGCMPFAQLYQPADQFIKYSPDWKRLNRKWSRPAAMMAAHKEAQ